MFGKSSPEHMETAGIGIKRKAVFLIVRSAGFRSGKFQKTLLPGSVTLLPSPGCSPPDPDQPDLRPNFPRWEA